MNNLQTLLGVAFFVAITIGAYEATKYFVSSITRSNVSIYDTTCHEARDRGS